MLLPMADGNFICYAYYSKYGALPGSPYEIPKAIHMYEHSYSNPNERNSNRDEPFQYKMIDILFDLE